MPNRPAPPVRTTTWYRVTRYSTTIETVRVIRETAQCIYRLGWQDQEHREAKESHYYRLYRTLEEAQAWITQRLEHEVEANEQQLVESREALQKWHESLKGTP